jgi:hypothetical protein
MKTTAKDLIVELGYFRSRRKHLDKSITMYTKKMIDIDNQESTLLYQTILTKNHCVLQQKYYFLLYTNDIASFPAESINGTCQA